MHEYQFEITHIGRSVVNTQQVTIKSRSLSGAIHRTFNRFPHTYYTIASVLEDGVMIDDESLQEAIKNELKKGK